MISEETIRQWDEEDRKEEEEMKEFDIQINRMLVISELKRKLKQIKTDRKRLQNAKTPGERYWVEYLILKREGYADVF